MFIRRTPTRHKATGEAYFTHRLVRSERIGAKVRQCTLLNLGSHFPLPEEDWPTVCARIEQILSAQATMLPLTPPIEEAAQRYAAQIVASAAASCTEAAAQKRGGAQYHEVDIASLELVRPRTVGVEQVGLWAMAQLGFVEKLKALGLSAVQAAAVMGNVIGRMAAPTSELGTFGWLCAKSALGELLEVDFEAMSLMSLYRASDALVKHREAIEAHLFGRICDLFSLEQTVTLYDLTNTYFEGRCAGNSKAALGHSKEKRTDAPLVTLALVLDASGFIHRSRLFPGNISEPKTLEEMLLSLQAPKSALVVMDCGIATEKNIAWLTRQGYRYLVVSRAGVRQFDAEKAVEISSATGQAIQIERTLSEDGKEALLYCHSTGREKKESAITDRLCQRFEAGLAKLAAALTKPRTSKRLEKLQERIGRLKAKSRGIGQHYEITVTKDPAGNKATSLTWEKKPLTGTMLTHPGVYCLRTNETHWDEATLWETYTMLTDLEAVFRSLKSELGLRPIFHSKERRTDGHLFISVLAYQFVQCIRRRLKAAGIHQSWAGLRQTLSVQQRVTATFRQRDARVLHVRKSTLAEPTLRQIYDVLQVSPSPGGIKKFVV
jgi:transposase